MTLNPQQTKAVGHDAGPLQVIAGPGTGKTRVVTERVLRLVRNGTKPDRILALTFTEKAAAEMAGRIRRALGEEGFRGQPKVSTFHSFCLDLVREHADLLSYDGEPRLLVGPLYVQYVADHVDELVTDRTDLVGKVATFARTLAEFASLCHDEGLVETDLLPRAKAWIAGLPAKERESLEKVLDLCASLPKLLAIQRRENVVTYGDLLTDAVRLVRDHPTAAEDLAGRWDHILVDELQDNNAAQFQLVDHLARAHGRITVVGDEDQSIYRFRGARMELLREFRERWSEKGALGELLVVPLEENYRSTEAIISTGQALIVANTQRFKEKRVVRAEKSEASGPDHVSLAILDTEDGERRWIAHAILERIAAGAAPGSIALLCRSLGHVPDIVADLRRAGVAVEVVGGGGLFASPIVREAIAWLKVLDDPVADEVALQRVLGFTGFGLSHADRRALGRTAANERIPLATLLERLESDAGAAPGLSPAGRDRVLAFLALVRRFRDEARPEGRRDVATLIQEVLHLTGLARRLRPDTARGRQDLAAAGSLLSVARNFEENYPHASLHGFVAHIDLLEELGLDDTAGEPSDDPSTVKVMTVHQAKGREWPVVLVTGVTDRFPMRLQRSAHRKLLDHLGGVDDPKTFHIEEERRVLYVAITRAKSELLLVGYESRNGKPVDESPYVAELEAAPTVRRLRIRDAEVPELPDAPLPLRTRAAAEARLHFLVSRLGAHVGGAPAGVVAEMARLIAGLVAEGPAGKEGARAALRALGLPDDVEARWLDPEPPGGYAGPLRLSASSLNKYIACPRQFYYGSIARIPAAVAGDAAFRGTVLHSVLEDFHRRHPVPKAADLPALLAAFRRAVADIPFPSAAERAQFLESKEEILRVYLEEEIARGERSIFHEAEFTLALAEDVVVMGYVDRVDETSDGAIRIVDYKTGNVESAATYRDEDLQMPIYAWAANDYFGRKLHSVEVIGLKELKRLKGGPRTIRIVLPWDDDSENALTPGHLAGVKARVASIVEGIRAGRFEPAPDEETCGRCSFRLLCERAYGVHGEDEPTVSLVPKARREEAA